MADTTSTSAAAAPAPAASPRPPRSEAQRRASQKWDAEHMTTIGLKLPRTTAAQYRAAALRAGTTVSSVCRAALDKLVEDHPET